MQGEVVKTFPTHIYLLVHGITYEVFCSLQSLSIIQSAKSNEVSIATVEIIREDAHLLFGFMQESEKALFMRLIKINGVGPKVAMAICSTFSVAQFASLLEHSDVKMLQKVPGIGAKSAGRILVELNGFEQELVQAPMPTGNQKVIQESTQALETLGFSTSNIAKVLKQCPTDSTQACIKEALKLLQRL